ncbi:MAG: zinc ribbon domain-containing protein [Anaerolineae bacterium]|jgi:hypothetical protein|nr:zinc ribbon domain-containing protein [Anaerolineae bacterium]
MKRFLGRIGRSLVRFSLKHWAGALILLLLLLAALTGYQMWHLGPVMALALFPQLMICLILIGAVVAVRRAIRAIATKDWVQSGVAQGRTVLKTTVEEAKGTLASLGTDVKRDLERFVGGAAEASAADPPVRCPRCGRVSRPGARFCEGCGAALYIPCPRCGCAMRADARFCMACGAALGRMG